MRKRVGELLEAGWSRQRIARELGVDPSTITRHARLLGYPDVIPRQSPFDWNAIQGYYDQGHTIDECKERFGVSYGAWDKAAVRGDILTRLRSKRQLTHETRDRVEALLADGLKLLVVGRTGTNRTHLKSRLIKGGLKENRCEICGLSEWLGKPLSLELHHVNGDGADNRLENLQLLCGNCHSQTDNWGGQGIRRKAVSDELAA